MDFRLGIFGVTFYLCLHHLQFFLNFCYGYVVMPLILSMLNGLSSYTIISPLQHYIGFIRWKSKSNYFSCITYCRSFRFMVLKFPLGKIFLGDGGAYALGHLGLFNGADVRIYLLIFLADTGLAIWRR